MAIVSEYHVDCDGWPGSDLGSHEDAACVRGVASQKDAIEQLRYQGWTVARYQGMWTARCPRHNDRTARGRGRRELDATRAYLTAVDEWSRENMARTFGVLCKCGHNGSVHRQLTGSAWPLECESVRGCDCIVYQAAEELPPAKPKPIQGIAP